MDGPAIGTGEIGYALGALVVLAGMCMLYPHALRHADKNGGNPGLCGEIFRNAMWVLKVANVLGWSLLVATMVTDLAMPIDPRVIAISTSLVAFSLMDMDNYLARRKAGKEG